MPQTNSKKEPPSEMRMVVEVDGHPIGSLNLDIERLWPLINHRGRDVADVEWIDADQLDTIMRAAVMKRLIRRLQKHLYQALGDEMVKAELDVETFSLKTESAAQAFGRTHAEIQKLVADSDRTTMDFYTFFWEYLLDDRDVVDLKKEWKDWSAQIRPGTR